MRKINKSFVKYYINPNSVPVVLTCLVMSHEGLDEDLCLISDNKPHMFNKVKLSVVNEPVSFLAGSVFRGFPMEITKSSLDFGDVEGRQSIKLMDAGDELADAFHNTRGFERAQILVFDCMLTDPYTLENLARYNVLNASRAKNNIMLIIGNFNSLKTNSVVMAYDEDNNPGLF